MHKYTSIAICTDVHFTSSTADDAIHTLSHTAKPAHWIEITDPENPLDCIHISTIHSVCDSISDAIELHPDNIIVVCPKNASLASLGNALQLFGAYTLLNTNIGLQLLLESSFNTLEAINCQNTNAAIRNCWTALHHARSLRWIGDMPAQDIEPVLDVEMAAHYALPANGNIHVLIPGKLLLFPAPAPLPAGQAWADETADGQPPVRRFGAGFLGELLAELGVAVVACLGRADGGDAAALEACGLDVHELGLDAGRAGLLGALDHLVAVSRAAPGAVGVYGGGGGQLGTVVAAWAMRECGFGAGGAGAWVRMVCPGLAGENEPEDE